MNGKKWYFPSFWTRFHPRLSSRILFYPSLIYTMLMERLSSREWFNRVDPNLIIGAIPFKSMGQALVDQEVNFNKNFLQNWIKDFLEEKLPIKNITSLIIFKDSEIKMFISNNKGPTFRPQKLGPYIRLTTPLFF